MILPSQNDYPNSLYIHRIDNAIAMTLDYIGYLNRESLVELPRSKNTVANHSEYFRANAYQVHQYTGIIKMNMKAFGNLNNAWYKS
jgi:hypothetical protein